jgi:hypothetical protein
MYSGTLHDCIAVVKHAKDDFMQHVKAPREFIEGILGAYTKTMPDAPGEYGDTRILEQAISCLEDFLDRASRGQDGILQLCGVNDEWRAADGVCRFMRDMMGMIEDILCYALSRDSDLAAAYMEEELLYQNYKF